MWESWLEDIYVQNVIENEKVDRESEAFRAEFETYMQSIKARIDTMTFDDYYNLESSYSLTEVELPEGYVTIPSSVKSIGKDCFIGLDYNGILCKKGSVAER